MTETEMFNKHLKPLVSCGVRFESVENRAHNSGFPDTIYFKRSGNGTTELKTLPRLKYPVCPDWQLGQISKNRTLQMYSKKVFLLIWIEETFYLLNKFQQTYTQEEFESCLIHKSLTLDKAFTLIL